MSTDRYSIEELLEDVQGGREFPGYGRVYYVGEGGRVARVLWTAGAAPRLDEQKAACFVGGLYAFLETTRLLTLYRWYDELPDSKARPLGSWWTTHRPSAEIDPTRLSSLHKTARSDLALDRKWNRMHSVLEATLATGAQAYVGRAAKQVEEDMGTVLAGGVVQFLLTDWARGRLTLTRSHSWVR